MPFKENWVNFIFRAATGSRKYRNVMTPLGFIVFVSVLTMTILLSLVIDKLFRFQKIFPHPWDTALGLPILALGLLLTLWSVLHFLKMKGTPVPFNPPPKLVSSGPYAFARNPMLSGVFAALFGAGIYIGSISLAFILVPLLILLNYLELKNIEEPELEKRLGQEYIDYKKRVPMFWPRIGKSKREIA